MTLKTISYAVSLRIARNFWLQQHLLPENLTHFGLIEMPFDFELIFKCQLKNLVKA
jgi:hypothetical protein